jgi:5-methylcytosine-specific restriction protein A
MLPSAVDIDHVIPLCAGGSDTPGNVQVLCREVCHKAKTRRDMGYAKAPF